MSSDRLVFMEGVPDIIVRTFRMSSEVMTPEQSLWREAACRATLDALGMTGESDPQRSNKIVREARRWFKIGHAVVGTIYTPREMFELADVDFDTIYREVLSFEPYYKEEESTQ